MDQQTLELLRVLQSDERDAGALQQIQSLLPRARLGAGDDRAALADISELLEVWAETAPPELAAAVTVEAAQIADEDLEQAERALQLYMQSLSRAPSELEPLRKLDALLLKRGEREQLEAILVAHAEALCAVKDVDPALCARVYQHLGQVRAERGIDLDAAIEAYERSLDLAPEPGVIAELAELYARRGSNGDAAQAADLLCTLGDVLGAEQGAPMLERSLDLVPGHEAALELLETYVPAGEQATRLWTRWAAYIDATGDEASADKRRMLLAHAYAELGRPRDALISLGPLIDKSDPEALRLQAAYLASLQEGKQRESAAAQPAAKPGKGNGAAVRPPTLVGFRVPAPGNPSSAAGPRSEPPGPIAAAAEPAEQPSPETGAPVEPAGPQEPGAGALAVPVQQRVAGSTRAKAAGGLARKRPARSGETLVGFRIPLELAGDGAAANAAAALQTGKAAQPSRSAKPRDPRASAASGAAAGARPAGAAARATDKKPAKTLPAAAKTPAGQARAAQPAAAMSPPAQSPVPQAPPATLSGAAAKAAALKARRSAAPPAAGRSSAPSAPPALGAAAARASRPSGQPAIARGRAPSAPPALARASAAPALVQAGDAPPFVASAAPPPFPSARASAAAQAALPAEVAPAAAEAASMPGGNAVAAAELEAPLPGALSSLRARFPLLRGKGGLIAAGAGLALLGLIAAFALGGRKRPPPPVLRRHDAVAAEPTAAKPEAPAPKPVAAAPAPKPVEPPAVKHEAPAPKKASRAEPEVKITAGRPHVKGGGLSAQQISLVLEDTLPAIEHCYRSALAHQSHLHGRVVFGWTITRHGATTHVRKLHATLKDRKLQRCAIEAIDKAHFPRPKKKTSEVTWPVEFHKG